MAKDQTIQKQLDNFDKQRCVNFLMNRYQTKSMMEIVGIHRDENKHSDFLAWLFDSFPPSHSMAPKRNGIVLN